MNPKTIASIVCCGMYAFFAQAEYREFTDANGRALSAKLVSYNDLQNKVTLKCEGKGIKTFPINIFSETDQQYIISWNKNQDFLSDKKLKVEFNRNKTKKTDGSWSNSWQDRKYYDCSFTIEFENRSTVDFNNVEFEYVIYYSQDHPIHNWTDRKEEHGTLYVRKTIALPKKSTKEIETEKIILFYRKVGSSSYGSTDLEGEVHGIMLNLSIKTATGETISRQIKFPSNLDHAWTPKTTDVQIKWDLDN